jgi:lysophospholipase L1-like esterase
VSIAATRLLLGPVLLLQGRRVRRDTPRLPEAAGAREGLEASACGATALRLLVVGDSSAAGVGVERQEAALAQPMARALAARLGVAVRWQLVARSGVCAEEAIDLVRSAEVAPADVLATAVGMNDVTGQRAPRFVRDMAELWRVASERSGARVGVITGLPPLHLLPAAPQPLRWYLGRYASDLDRRLEAWIAGEPRLRHCSLQWTAGPGSVAADGFHPGPAGYARWSALMAEKACELVRRTGAPA